MSEVTHYSYIEQKICRETEAILSSIQCEGILSIEAEDNLIAVCEQLKKTYKSKSEFYYKLSYIYLHAKPTDMILEYTLFKKQKEQILFKFKPEPT